MSSVDELRQAAETLRQQADHAGGADDYWEAEIHPDGRAWVNTRPDRHAMALHGMPAAATYIATMHPGVGLALAAWLDEEAEWSAAESDTEHATALARLING